MLQRIDVQNTVQEWLETGEVDHHVIREADFEGPIGVVKHAIEFKSPALPLGPRVTVGAPCTRRQGSCK
jgi:hypothetical protein